jgi:hypothetical protein
MLERFGKIIAARERESEREREREREGDDGKRRMERDLGL